MRRSSIFLLLGAVLLGLLAVFAARTFMVPAEGGQKGPEVPRATVVVAKEPLAFGDKLVIEKVRAIEWPGEVPEGAFSSVKDAVGEGDRTALREIKANEIVLATAVTGNASRLASSKLLGPDMRAVSVPVSETSAAGGFVAPGDRVDVLVTRAFEGDVTAASVIVQGARVLAVGQRSDPSSSAPELTKSATLEVTPAEAQKVALAQTVGNVHLALRPTGDESQVPTRTATTEELFGPIARPRLTQASAEGGAPAGPPAPPKPTGPQVSVTRGTVTTSYGVPR